jgi:hypothetical protein
MSDQPRPGTSVAVSETNNAIIELTSMLRQAIRDPSFDAAKLSAVLDFQDRLIARQRKEVAEAAFVRLMARMPRIRKNKIVFVEKGTKEAYRYAPIEDIDSVIRTVCASEGFTISYRTEEPKEPGRGGIIMVCVLHHDNGHDRETPMWFPQAGQNRITTNLQAMGSTATYAQRTVLRLALNLIFEGEDDDGARGGSETISNDEVNELMALIAETKANQIQILNTYGIDQLEDMPVINFIACKNTLLSRRERLGSRP